MNNSTKLIANLLQTKFSLILIFSFFIIGENKAQIGRLALSPLQKIEQNIAKTDITITYCRPSARGRTIFGGLVKYNEYWRTGANRNTTIEFSEKVIIGDKEVAKGKYAIMTKPSEKQWAFILYSDTDNWDVPEEIEEEKIVAKINIDAKELASYVENLTIGIDDFDNYKFDLSIKWEKTQIIVPIQLSTKSMMDDIISTRLAGPNSSDYYSAANYEFESGKNYEKGLEWINKGIELRDEKKWWDYRVKAHLLMNLGKNKEAKRTAKEGLKLATEKKSGYGIREFESILERLK